MQHNSGHKSFVFGLYRSGDWTGARPHCLRLSRFHRRGIDGLFGHFATEHFQLPDHIGGIFEIQNQRRLVGYDFGYQPGDAPSNRFFPQNPNEPVGPGLLLRASRSVHSDVTWAPSFSGVTYSTIPTVNFAVGLPVGAITRSCFAASSRAMGVSMSAACLSLPVRIDSRNSKTVCSGVDWSLTCATCGRDFPEPPEAPVEVLSDLLQPTAATINTGSQ